MKNYLELELYELLKKDNSIFDFIQYTLLNGIWYWDLEHPENEWMNERFWATLGYDPKEMPNSPEAWQNIINSDDLALALENFQLHLENNNHPYDQEVRYTHKNGSTVWIRCYGKVIRDDSGKPIRMLGLHIDITKFKNSKDLIQAKDKAVESEKGLLLKNLQYESLNEELWQINLELQKAKEHSENNENNLLKLNQKLEFLLDTLPIGISILDKEGRVTKNNKFLNKILEMSNQDLREGLHKKRDYYKSDLRLLEASDFPSSRILKGEKEVLNFEVGIRKEDGSVVWTNVNAIDCTLDDWKVVITTSDITENKTNRDELQKAKDRAEKNERNFSRIIDTVPVMLYDYILHPNGESNFLFVSSNCQDILEVGQEELLSDINRFWELVHKDDLQRLLEEDKSANSNGGIFYSQARIITKSGKLKWLEISSRPSSFKPNHSNTWSGYIKDITEQKNAELALVEAKEKAEISEKRIRTTLDCLLEGCQIIDFDWKYVYLNQTAEIHNQRPNSELLGKRYMDMWPGITETDVFKKIKNCLEERNSFHLENEFIFPSGEKGWFDLSIQPVPEGVFILSVDITKRKFSEQALLRNKQELQKAQEITHVGSWYLDIATNKVTWSEELYKMYGFDPALAPPPFTEHMKLFTPESWEILSTSLARTAETGIPYELELKTVRKDKNTGWMWVRGEAIFDEKNKISGLWGAAQDITDRKNSEEELRIAKEKAEESDRLKTAFLQNMSHEIRTPMNAIMGFSSLMSENYDDQEKLRLFSKIIDQRCNDLLDIINDILDISKIESGQNEVNIVECNLNELFSELSLFFQDYKNRINKQHIQLNMSRTVQEGADIIRTDKIKLKQILINLISNAFKYTLEGFVECGFSFGKNEVLFYVSDTGVGIPKDKYDFIFERFSQLKNPSHLNIGGTGLGLTIVKGLVEQLGGKVWLNSDHQRGTTFFFTIKLIKSEFKIVPLVTNTKDFNVPIPISEKKLLIVEDDHFNALYLHEILSKIIPNIFKVGSGTEAIDFVKNQPVDIVLMDIRLPDITGYKAISAILELYPQMTIIAQTAYAAPDERQKALATGCADYISKPTQKEHLLSVLNRFI